MLLQLLQPLLVLLLSRNLLDSFIHEVVDGREVHLVTISLYTAAKTINLTRFALLLGMVGHFSRIET